MAAEFQQGQFHLARHLRDPQGVRPPEGVEERRLAIYRELIYNNLESFLASGFPVLKSVLAAEHWHSLVRGFLRDHRCQTPYFLEIGQEFLRYLQEIRRPEGWEPPFLWELAHYEWVELALDTSEVELPDPSPAADSGLDGVYDLSPLAWRLTYQYPVHRISPEWQPVEPIPSGVYLLVYRDREDRVGFLEINGVVSSLVQRVDDARQPLRAVLAALATELGHADFAGFLAFARPLVEELVARSILLPQDCPERRILSHSVLV